MALPPTTEPGEQAQAQIGILGRMREDVQAVFDRDPAARTVLEVTLAYPGLIRRALDRGAWVHTDSGFVAGEVVEAFGADPERVRVVNPGIPALPEPSDAEAEAAVRRLLPAGTARYCLAVGTADGHPAIWRRASNGSWTLESAAALSAVAGSAGLASVAHGPAGWIAVGNSAASRSASTIAQVRSGSSSSPTRHPSLVRRTTASSPGAGVAAPDAATPGASA